MQDRVSHALSLLREAVAILSELPDVSGHTISRTLELKKVAEDVMAGRQADIQVVREEVQTDKESFADWLRAEMKARFPEADGIQQHGINNLFQLTGGDTSLVADLFDIADKMNQTRQKVYKPFGLMVSTLRKMNHDDIREEAAAWRERKANKKETITERVLRKTLEDVGPGKGRQQIDEILARKVIDANSSGQPQA